MTLRGLVEWMASKLPFPRTIYDRDGGSPYLSRWYLTARPTMPDGSSPYDASGDPKPGVLWPVEKWGLYLHKFHRSDGDGAPHNHPWKWALSLILVGGYSEQRKVGQQLIRRLVAPLSLNFISHDDFHRVDLLEQDAWSLFLVGPKVSSWGFWEAETNQVIPWREFITRIRGYGWNES